MSLKFSVSIDRSSLNSIISDIDESLLKKAPFIGFSIINQIGDLPRIKKFKNFLKSNQFAGDFGIDNSTRDNIAFNFSNVFDTISTIEKNLSINREPTGIRFSIIDQDYLREITQTVWEPVLFSTSIKPPIFVNAWDIYEYGVIGGKKTSGKVKGFKEIEAKSVIQKKLSRSKLNLMVKSKNDNFTFIKGDAPKINSVRSTIISNIGKIEKITGRLLERLGKL